MLLKKRFFCLGLFTITFFLLYGPISRTLNFDTMLIGFFFGILISLKYPLIYLSTPALLALALQFYVAAISVANNYWDLDWAWRFLRIYVHMIATWAVSRYVIERFGVTVLLKFVVIATAVASLSIIASALNESTSDFMLQEFQSDFAREQFTGARYSAIFRTFVVSLPLMFANLFLVELWVRKEASLRSVLALSAAFMAAAALNARAGLIIGLFILAMYVFMHARTGVIAKGLFATLLCFGAGSILALAGNPAILEGTRLYAPMWHFTEPFRNFVHGRGFTSASTDQYFSSFWDWPTHANMSQAVFGTAHFGRTAENYLYTDNGYAFIYAGLGVVGVTLVILLAVSLCGVLVAPRRPNSQSSMRLLCMLIGLAAVVYNFKESVLFSRHFLAFSVVALAMFYAESQSEGVKTASTSGAIK